MRDASMEEPNITSPKVNIQLSSEGWTLGYQNNSYGPIQNINDFNLHDCTLSLDAPYEAVLKLAS
jgi:hypothetical protein